jgi:hypothetical protein
MNTKGWIKLHRNILTNDNWLEIPFDKPRAWIDMLLLCNDGVLEISKEKLAKRWGWSYQNVRTYLANLEANNQINQQTTNKLTIINIDKWGVYQTTLTNKLTTTQQPSQQTTRRSKEDKKKEITPLTPQKNLGGERREILGFEFYIWLFNKLFKTNTRTTRGRQSKFRLRLKTIKTPDDLYISLMSMASIDFYQGRGERGWVATPDFHLRSDETVAKFLEKSDSREFEQDMKVRLPELKRQFTAERKEKTK